MVVFCMALVAKRQRLGRMVVLLLLGSILAGCVSASLEDAAPTEGQSTGTAGQAGETSDSDNSFVQEGAIRNETFPTFEQAPVAATEQLSSADKSRLEAEMDAARTAYGAGALSEAAYRARIQELQTLAKTHARDVEDKLQP